MKQDLWQRIERSRSRWNVLEHPFYQRWSAGELTAEELGRYAGEYRHAVEAIAAASAAAAGAGGEAREELARHAAEEAAHLRLWDAFREAVGGGREEAAPAPETAECVASWTGHQGLLANLAVLYAIESGQPEISRIKREGLIAHYGIEDGPATEYFAVHAERDAAHSAEARRLIEERLDGADPGELAAIAESAFHGNWRLLDGVERHSVENRG